MKALKLNYMILLVIALIFSSVSLFAQQEDNKEVKKEIIIIKETVDEDGNVTTKKIIRKGDVEDMDMESINGEDVEIIEIDGTDDIQIIKLEELEGLSDEMKEKLKNIEVDIDEDQMNRKIKIIMDHEGEDGEPVIIEWEGEGDIPEDIKQKMEEHGVIMNGMDHDNHFFGIKTSDSPPNKACLGVMIGKTVENENGVETIRGESDQGVTVLDIIENSGAQEAGLLKDDIITAINGTGVASIHDVLDILKPFEGGATVSIDYLRNNHPAQINATLKACENKMKIKHFEGHGDNDFEFDKEMNWVIESDDDGEDQGKRTIIIKKSMKNSEGEGNEVAETDTPDDVIFTPSENLDQTLELQEFNLYPNPTEGNLTVEFKSEAVPTTVKVLDISGKEIYSEELLDFNGTYKKEINLENAPKGTLMFTIEQNEKVFAEKVMVQ